LGLRDHFIANNSRINTRSISDSPNGALQCITDKSLDRACRHGDWYLPNGDKVTERTLIYRSEEDIHNEGSAVSLNRPSFVLTPTAQFCCKTLDATYVLQTRCVIIGKQTMFMNMLLCLHVYYLHTDAEFQGALVTPLGFPIAGESYTLECIMCNPVILFEWLRPPDGRTPVTSTSSSLITNFDSYTSQLQFRPLQQSHIGSYSCRATTREGTFTSEPREIQVNGSYKCH
jgi:hypothetical protein